MLQQCWEWQRYCGFFKPDVFSHRADCKLGAAQLSLFVSEEVDVIHIYRSQQQNLRELAEKVLEWRNEDKVMVVCGDLNVCLKKEPKNVFSQSMEDWDLKQIGREATHERGGQIDHLYVSSQAVAGTTLERVSMFYSDHDALCVTADCSIVQVLISNNNKKDNHLNTGQLWRLK